MLGVFSGGDAMSDFLAFRKMITTLIIRIIFWLGVIAAVIAGLGMLVDGRSGGLALLILGPLAVRIYCELLIVIFRINETLTEIKNLLEKRPM
jgi:uncharacterized membrane protein